MVDVDSIAVSAAPKLENTYTQQPPLSQSRLSRYWFDNTLSREDIIYNKIREYVGSFNHYSKRYCSPRYAVSVIIQGDKLLVCQSRRYLKPNNKRAKRELQHAGGTIEAGETPEAAAWRELREEAWNDLPDEIKAKYDFPKPYHTQKIYFGGDTVIFIHKVSTKQKLYEGPIYVGDDGSGNSNDTSNGSGEMEYLHLVKISDVYKCLNTGINGVPWRRCTVWSLKRLRHIFELYALL